MQRSEIRDSSSLTQRSRIALRFIRATTFARYDLPPPKHRLPPLIEREHAFPAIFGSDQAIVSLDLERQPIPHRHLQAAMNGLLGLAHRYGAVGGDAPCNSN